MFASMYAAYDALSDGLKQTLSGLRAVHSSRHVFGVDAARHARPHRQSKLAGQDAIHPVVITHPESGRPALYVNPGFTLRFDGWTGRGVATAAALFVSTRGAARVHLSATVTEWLIGVSGPTPQPGITR